VCIFKISLYKQQQKIFQVITVTFYFTQVLNVSISHVFQIFFVCIYKISLSSQQQTLYVQVIILTLSLHQISKVSFFSLFYENFIMYVSKAVTLMYNDSYLHKNNLLM